MEQMQNEFENFACKELMDISKKYGDSYRDIRTHYAWLAWQASRQAVEIIAPQRYSIDCFENFEKDDNGFLVYYDSVEKSITAAGLRIKQR